MLLDINTEIHETAHCVSATTGSIVRFGQTINVITENLASASHCSESETSGKMPRTAQEAQYRMEWEVIYFSHITHTHTHSLTKTLWSYIRGKSIRKFENHYRATVFCGFNHIGYYIKAHTVYIIIKFLLLFWRIKKKESRWLFLRKYRLKEYRLKISSEFSCYVHRGNDNHLCTHTTHNTLIYIYGKRSKIDFMFLVSASRKFRAACAREKKHYSTHTESTILGIGNLIRAHTHSR